MRLTAESQEVYLNVKPAVISGNLRIFKKENGYWYAEITSFRRLQYNIVSGFLYLYILIRR